MSNPNKITSFSIRQLLADNASYQIPMYQRNYAWEQGEIDQLIQDVVDYQVQKKPYYIGSLVVYPRDNQLFEVIDGQQRFTTLTLIALCLKHFSMLAEKEGTTSVNKVDMSWYQTPNLCFESRANSTLTLEKITAFSASTAKHLLLDPADINQCNSAILNGFNLVQQALSELAKQHDLHQFCNYLFDWVKITRVPVPHDTDLTHYFEAMNNRGEQLEKHEVLKARMLSVLQDASHQHPENKSAQEVLNKVWNACANMERYVQFGFNHSERQQIFGNEWQKFTANSFTELHHALISPENRAANITADTHSDEPAAKSLAEMLNTPYTDKQAETDKNQPSPERFNSVINFSNFLLQVLRVHSQKDISLDDKQLIDQFETHILHADDAAEKVKAFVFALLKSKYLFDHYVIKRDATAQDKWGIKQLKRYERNSQNYVNTFAQNDQPDTAHSQLNQRIVLLLSAFHVSTPTMNYKHWLTGVLHILHQLHAKQLDADNYLKALEKLARSFIYGRYLAKTAADYYTLIFDNPKRYQPLADTCFLRCRLRYGSIKNNFVFNYLDYLLWCTTPDKDQVYREFEFSFRSSVEHFYPQNPYSGEPLEDPKILHSFGNLCLISHSKNAKLSNYQPTAKKEHFQAASTQGKIDSLKLYEMSRVEVWDADAIHKHETQMLGLFIKDSEGEK